MSTVPSSFQLAENFTARVRWSMHTLVFVHEWRQRAKELAVPQPDDYLAEATAVVLGALEQLDEQVAQTLRDLYCLTRQLPAPGDTLLVGPLQLRVEDREIEITYPEGREQVALVYDLDIERYRYEPLRGAPAQGTRPTSRAELV